MKPTLEADKHSLVFIDSNKPEKNLLSEQTKADVVICDDETFFSDKLLEQKCFIVVDNPKLIFSKIGNALILKKPKFGIHPTAFIHPDAKISPMTYIGPFTYVGCCEIDAGSIIYGHAHLLDGVKIGKNVIINAGCVIGSDGFGYIKDEQDEWENFPHMGGVIIEDNVEIGANTCVDKGALGNTLIKKGAKIDNLVHIAHNVKVGKNALVIADAMIGGSVNLGDGSWISPSAVLRDQISVGSNSLVGMGALVTKDIPDNQIWAGSPARPLEELRQIQDKIKDWINRS